MLGARIGCLIAFGLVGVGCEDRLAQHAARVADHNPLMNEAMATARQTVHEFVDALNSPQNGQSEFRVKKAFIDGEEVEHIWLDNVTKNGQDFRGYVSRRPEYVHNAVLGELVAVRVDEISDWMYVDQGTLVGGFTIRVLRNALHPKEREHWDNQAPYRVE